MIATTSIALGRRFGITLAVTVALCATVALRPEVTRAQELQVTGPLAGAPAVHDLRLWRKNRVHLQPMFAFTLGDEFSRSMFVGAQVQYHFLDWLGVGAYGAYGVAQLNTNLTKEIKANGRTTNNNRLSFPSRQGFGQQVGRLTWMAGVDLNFVPLRGKISLFQKIFLDTDLSFFAGVAAVGVEERANYVPGPGEDVCGVDFDPGNPAPCLATQSANATRVAIAPSFGVAFSAHFAKFMGISITWRGIPFKWNTSGFDRAPSGQIPDGRIDSNDRTKQFNHLFSVGYIIYLPPKIKSQ